MCVRHIAVGALILCLTGPAVAGVPEGQKLFGQRCAACHTVNDKNGVGPSLQHVIGRKAAALPKYMYSTALTKSGLSWTPETLDAFLAAPTKVVSGTRMAVALPVAKQRSDVIAYLASLK